MSHNLSLIKALVTTLHLEIDSLDKSEDFLNADETINLCETVREYEIKIIKAALLKTGGNQRQAAKMLGVKTSTLNNKIKTYKIDYLRLNAH